MKLRITISRKIQLCVIIMILVTVVLIVGITFPNFEKKLAEATKNQLMDQVTAEAQNIDNIVKEYRQLLDNCAESDDMLTQLEGEKEADCSDELVNLCRSEDNIQKAVLFNREGAIVANTGTVEEEDAEQAIVESVLDGSKEYALSGVVGSGSGKEAVMLVVPVYKSQSQVVGALAGFIGYSVFDEAVKQCSVTGIKNLAAYIMDKDGIIFGHTEENKVGTEVKNSVIQDVVVRLKNGENIESDGTSYEYNGEEKFAGYYVIPDSQWIVCFSVSESEIISPIRKVELRVGIICLVQCIFACLVVVILTNLIVKPIRVANHVLNSVAGYCFKIEEDYDRYASNKDETGEMCTSIGMVVDSLRDEITQISSVSEELTSTAHALKKIATSVAKYSDDNGVLMEEMTDAFDGIEDAASNINQFIGNVRESAGEMSRNAEESMAKAQSLMERAAEIKGKAVKADEESEGMFCDVKQAMETAVGQSKSVEKISMFTDTISSISKKTKMLAINAAIEAANAGEHGKGFAVVAKEIETLAAQSSQSADSITQLVQEIYQAVDGLKNCLEKSLSYMEEHVIPDYRQFSSSSEEYSKDAEKVIQSMTLLKNEIHGFTDAMDKSVQAVEHINTNIIQSAEKMHSMSEDNANVGLQIQETYEMVKSNSELSKRLKNIVEKYTI